MIKSPLNYTGGKYKLLPQILPLFPQDINNFIDLFCGGCDVGVNVKSEYVLFNDIDENVIGIINAFRELGKEAVFNIINDTIERFRLSDVSTNSYAFYNAESSIGLGNYNRQRYNNLREYFNQLNERNHQYYILLYVLVIYSFNNQIRFNSKGEFNLPVGKRDFNKKMQANLSSFITRLEEINCDLLNNDFRFLNLENLEENDFVYADPPYLITCASYNEKGGWNEDLEISLYQFLDGLHAHHIRFALSNVLTSKGRTNNILQQWLVENPHYTCHHLNYNYSNSSYQLKDRTSVTDEVLITNY